MTISARTLALLVAAHVTNHAGGLVSSQEAENNLELLRPHDPTGTIDDALDAIAMTGERPGAPPYIPAEPPQVAAERLEPAEPPPAEPVEPAPAEPPPAEPPPA